MTVTLIVTGLDTSAKTKDRRRVSLTGYIELISSGGLAGQPASPNTSSSSRQNRSLEATPMRRTSIASTGRARAEATLGILSPNPGTPHPVSCRLFMQKRDHVRATFPRSTDGTGARKPLPKAHRRVRCLCSDTAVPQKHSRAETDRHGAAGRERPREVGCPGLVAKGSRARRWLRDRDIRARLAPPGLPLGRSHPMKGASWASPAQYPFAKGHR